MPDVRQVQENLADRESYRLRLLAWNILQGAPERGTRVVSAIRGHRPDVVVLTEFHAERSRNVAEGLKADGLQYCAGSPARNGLEVFIASRTPLQSSLGPETTPTLIGGYLEVAVPEHHAIVAGVYVPVMSAVGLPEKRSFWATLHEMARRHGEEPYALVGDLNTGDFPLDKENPERPFSCTSEYRKMRELGFVDAWREMNGDRREYSWKSNRGAGFRIDHAFISPVMRSRLTGAHYSHSEREAKISDHSLLIVDLAPAAA
jgi:exodeoxyribonuclease III